MQQCHGVVVGAERWAALQRAVQRGAQREHIRGKVGFATAGDFRSQVGRRPVDHPAACQRRIPQSSGDSEVADQRRTVIGDQDVARLHVAVDDADRMGGCQC